MGRKTIMVCGVCELRKNEMEKMGISEVISLIDPFTAPEDVMAKASRLITQKISENA